jgi:hypothetical protein
MQIAIGLVNKFLESLQRTVDAITGAAHIIPVDRKHLINRIMETTKYHKQLLIYLKATSRQQAEEAADFSLEFLLNKTFWPHLKTSQEHLDYAKGWLESLKDEPDLLKKEPWQLHLNVFSADIEEVEKALFEIKAVYKLRPI